MYEALIFLAGAVMCVPIAEGLGLGSVLGYLIAGAAIGPWGLRFIGDVGSTQNLAELGVVLMLFVIGLELDPRRLVTMQKEVCRGGAIQLGVCGAALGLALLALGLSWRASLVAGLALAPSSTAIAVQAMRDRNELDTPTGRAAFGILLFQDIAAIPLIALVPLIGHVERPGAMTLWMSVGAAVAAIAGVVVIGRYLTRPLLRLIAKTNVRELFTAFTLLLVIGIAELMAFAGLSVALSMATTPVFLKPYDGWTAAGTQPAREPDAIAPEGPVIIAGFGRFGQIVGRLLLANDIRAVVLDHDPDQVDSLRKFGYKVFYGDATRLDLLEAAGARKARLLVNAIDDVDASIALVERVRANFPDLEIVSRARNVSHYFELRLRGVTVVERETFESALKVGRSVLERLGVDPFRAKELADAFRRHNIASVDATLPFYQDEARRLSLAKQGREELERQFARDRERFEREHGGKGWK